jgi:hypothetical protein
VVEYVTIRAEEGSDFVGCPTKSYITDISSWDPDKSLPISEAIKYFSSLDGISASNIGEYQQLQDVTTLSLTDFYNMFRMSNSSACVKSSKEMWASANK